MEKAIQDGPFVGLWWLIISVSNNHDLMYLYVEIKKNKYLYGDFGVKDLLAESAVVQDKCVHVQQVFLEIIY